MTLQRGPSRTPNDGVQPLLIAAAIIAVACQLARNAFGQPVLYQPLALGLQLPLLILWTAHAVQQRRRGDVILTGCVIAGAAAIGIFTRNADAAATAITLFIASSIALPLLGRAFRLAEHHLDDPLRLLRAFVPIWLAAALLATLILTLPIATQSSVPDYKHNFLLHVANNGFAAVSAACLTGWTSYGFGDDYTPLGQTVLWLVTQFSGCLFSAVGLSLARPFLRRPLSLRGLLLGAFILQGVVMAVAFMVWRDADAASPWQRFWWGAVYGADALWNTGLILRPDGLARYLLSGPIYALVTLLALAGSLGLPVIHDLLRGPASQTKTATHAPNAPDAPWLSLPAWEAGAAFWMLVAGALVLAVCETPGVMPDAMTFKRPFEFGQGQLSLRDDIGFNARASLSIHVSAMLRSAGIQSIALSEGGLTVPSYLLMLGWMMVGGSITGTAGGFRISTLVLLVLLLLPNRAWQSRPDCTGLRRRVMRSLAGFVVLWLGLTAGTVLMLGVLTDGSRYQIAFDGVAALNNVGLTTGLIVHLSWPARLFMIIAMIVGRLAPLIFWARLCMQFKAAAQGDAGPAAARGSPLSA